MLLIPIKNVEEARNIVRHGFFSFSEPVFTVASGLACPLKSDEACHQKDLDGGP